MAIVRFQNVLFIAVIVGALAWFFASIPSPNTSANAQQTSVPTNPGRLASNSTDSASSSNAGSIFDSNRASEAIRQPTDGMLIDPNELVLRAVQQSVWGPGFACQIRQQTHLFDRSMNAVGTYAQGGLGSGKLKLTVKLAVGEEVRTTQQISDGRMLWTSLDGEDRFRTVNVESVRQSVEKFGRKALERPDVALYLSVGGQSEVLRTLYLRYRWKSIWTGRMDDKSVWQLVGTRRSELPTLRSHALNDEVMLLPQGDAIPSEVRLTLANDTLHPLFPYKIEYFCRQKSKDGTQEELKQISTIEYFDIQVLPADEDYFHIVLRDDFRGREDETKRYLPP